MLELLFKELNTRKHIQSREKFNFRSKVSTSFLDRITYKRLKCSEDVINFVTNYCESSLNAPHNFGHS